jgi:hypothetical protein
MCYLPRRDGTVTALHVFLITLVFGLLLLFHRSIRQGHYDGLRTFWQLLKPAGAAAILSIALVASSLSYGALHGIPARQLALSKDPRAVVPWIFDKFGYDLFFDFKGASVSQLPGNYWCIALESDRLKSVSGAPLKKADLRYADVSAAFLVNANLRNADLRGARMRKSDFRMADLRGANLKGADLRQSHFHGADFREANLAGVNFAGTDLEEAKLGFADLKKSDFKDANLKGADLRCADLRGVLNLPIQDLAHVKSLYRAEMDEPLKKELQELKGELFSKPSDPWHDMTTPYNKDKKDTCE